MVELAIGLGIGLYAIGFIIGGLTYCFIESCNQAIGLDSRPCHLFIGTFKTAIFWPYYGLKCLYYCAEKH